jgi:uncharacterized protein (DUF433 family)
MSQHKTHSTLQDFIISRDPEVMGGTPVFAGTRVPITHLIEYLVGDYSLTEFTDNFPTVERSQLVDLLQRIGELVTKGDLTV